MADPITLAKKSLFTSNFKFYFAVEIGFMNGYLPVSFSSSFIEFLQFNKDRNKTDPIKSIQLSKLFSLAFEKIRSEEVEDIVPSTDNAKLAIACLNSFLQDYETHEAALNAVRNNESSTETEYCAVLATHLFSHLVPGGKATVSKSMRFPNKECPCGCPRKINLGNTGIGNKDVWHGFPDLLVEYTSVIMKSSQSDENDDSSDSCDGDNDDNVDYAVEVKKKKGMGNMKFSYQLTSQTITNAFAQRKPTGLKSHFYPSIGCTMDELIVMFYDPDNDILLRRIHPMALFKHSKLCLPSVVELWFILNLHFFNSKVGADIREKLGTAGVKSFFRDRDVLHLYEEAVIGASMKQFSTESFGVEGKDIYDVFCFEIID